MRGEDGVKSFVIGSMRQAARLLLGEGDADGKSVAALCQTECAIIIAAAVAEPSAFGVKGEQWNEKNARLPPSHEWRWHGYIVCSHSQSYCVVVMTKREGFILGDNHRQGKTVASFAKMACHSTDITLAFAGVIKTHHGASWCMRHEHIHEMDALPRRHTMHHLTIGALIETRSFGAKKFTGGGFMREFFG